MFVFDISSLLWFFKAIAIARLYFLLICSRTFSNLVEFCFSLSLFVETCFEKFSKTCWHEFFVLTFSIIFDITFYHRSISFMWSTTTDSSREIVNERSTSENMTNAYENLSFENLARLCTKVELKTFDKNFEKKKRLRTRDARVLQEVISSTKFEISSIFNVSQAFNDFRER